MTEDELTGRRILIAEDDALVREDLAQTLTERGAVVVLASTVSEAIALADEPFDHALLDVRLADGDVHPAAARLRERGVPVTFCSAAKRCDGLLRSFPGAQVIEKPAFPSKLVRALVGGQS